MNRILPLAGALVLAAATVSVAEASPASDAWVSRTGAALQSQVGAAGLSDDGKVVQIRVKVAPDGAGAVIVAGTSGSRDFDDAVKAAARRAAEHCRARGTPIAKLALQFALANPDIATTVAGSANPNNIRDWATWAAEPLDTELLAEVQAIFAPVKNIGHTEGLAENN